MHALQFIFAALLASAASPRADDAAIDRLTHRTIIVGKEAIIGKLASLLVDPATEVEAQSILVELEGSLNFGEFFVERIRESAKRLRGEEEEAPTKRVRFSIDIED